MKKKIKICHLYQANEKLSDAVGKILKFSKNDFNYDFLLDQIIMNEL